MGYSLQDIFSKTIMIQHIPATNRTIEPLAVLGDVTGYLFLRPPL